MRSLSLIVLLCLVAPVGAAVFNVTNGNDSGAGSLRAAIEAANANASDPHFISFDASVTTVTLNTPLPGMTRTMIVNAFNSNRVTLTKSGSDCWPASQSGLWVQGPDSILHNLAIEGCFYYGVRLSGSATNTALQGLRVVGSGANGLFIAASGVEVERSGTQGSEILDAGRSFPEFPSHLDYPMASAIRVTASNVRIRGSLIGAQVGAANKGGHGIYAIGAHGLVVGLDAGGAVQENHRNTLLRNVGSGIYAVDSNNIAIRGNGIGSPWTNGPGGNVGGQHNDQAGIRVVRGSGTVIGGMDADRGNLIGNNKGPGIHISGTNTGSVIEGNRIGAPEPDLSLANTGFGIFVSAGVTGLRIGDFAVDRQNLVASNLAVGIRLDGEFTQNIAVIGNSIVGNLGAGILRGNSANLLANTPTITQATPLISGTGANADGLVQVYADNGSQGRYFLGTAFVDGTGNWNLSVDLAPHAGRNLTATSSRLGTGLFETSDFSAAFPIPGAARPLSVGKTGSGSGLVTSNPAGIHCGSTCSNEFADGLQVTLTASADPGSLFAGWSGEGCAGTGTCIVTMSQARSVIATFNLAPTETLIFADGFE
ncbi:MAG TPA: hypothetical protein PKZ76_07585 [Xanthomonadaceae bacterium]|nr:hypothetical protein [Xanthomonadaceae bacterium]